MRRRERMVWSGERGKGSRAMVGVGGSCDLSDGLRVENSDLTNVVGRSGRQLCYIRMRSAYSWS